MSQSTKPVDGELHLKQDQLCVQSKKKRTGDFKGKISIIDDCPLDDPVGPGI